MPTTPEVTADGCPVAAYALLPEHPLVGPIAALAPYAGSVLDLGCGTGRAADPLADLGLRVTGVDSSAAMLSHVRRAERVRADIVGLRLGRTYDVVLLLSHLVNVPDRQMRGDLLTTVARHLAPGGTAVVEWHPPGWFDGLTAGHRSSGSVGDVELEFAVGSIDDGLLCASVTHRWESHEVRQDFTAARLTGDDLEPDLTAAGLALAHDDPPPGCLLLRRAPAQS